MNVITSGIVSVDNGYRGNLYDSHGVEIKDCVRADLDTGECLVLIRGKDGRFETNMSGVKTRTEKRHTPLRFELSEDTNNNSSEFA